MALGKTKVTTAPPPSASPMCTLPPQASMMLRVMARPRPGPLCCWSARQKRVNTRSLTYRGNPTPWAVIANLYFRLRTDNDIHLSGGRGMNECVLNEITQRPLQKLAAASNDATAVVDISNGLPLTDGHRNHVGGHARSYVAQIAARALRTVERIRTRQIKQLRNKAAQCRGVVAQLLSLDGSRQLPDRQCHSRQRRA